MNTIVVPDELKQQLDVYLDEKDLASLKVKDTDSDNVIMVKMNLVLVNSLLSIMQNVFKDDTAIAQC
jgi:hypothetical protein